MEHNQNRHVLNDINLFSKKNVQQDFFFIIIY